MAERSLLQTRCGTQGQWRAVITIAAKSHIPTIVFG